MDPVVFDINICIVKLIKRTTEGYIQFVSKRIIRVIGSAPKAGSTH